MWSLHTSPSNGDSPKPSSASPDGLAFCFLRAETAKPECGTSVCAARDGGPSDGLDKWAPGPGCAGTGCLMILVASEQLGHRWESGSWVIYLSGDSYQKEKWWFQGQYFRLLNRKVSCPVQLLVVLSIVSSCLKTFFKTLDSSITMDFPMKIAITVTKHLLSVCFRHETQGLVYAIKMEVFYIFMWNWRQWKGWGTWFAWTPFCCSMFEMVVTGQCYAGKFHFLRLSIQVFCFFFQCCGL